MTDILVVALSLSSPSTTIPFLLELEIENGGFRGEGKTEERGEKSLGAKERINNKFLPSAFEPWSHRR